MVNPNRFYTYAYLREDRTPYYIGKGQGKRLYQKGKGEVYPPKDKSRIIFLKQNLIEEDAFKHEIYMIAVFGRKDLGTGILRNKTGGGDGVSGIVLSEENKRKRSERMKGTNNPHYGKRGENSHMYGKNFSEETRRKQSEAKSGKNNPNYGKSNSEELKRKQSEIKKGKYTGENNPFYGKSHSEDAKRKQSLAKKGENNSNYGTQWWNDGCGNSKRSVECPGEGWFSGRGK
jgi:hypothetical protein